MSFFHQTSAGTARARRTKEREGHPRASSVSNSGRRHGANPKTQDNRTPPSKSPVLQNSIYSQQNLMLNQISGVPSAETSSSAPISPTSSIYHSNSHRVSGVIHLSQQPYTPVALQQYLDEDQGDDHNDNDNDDNDEHEEEHSKDEKKIGKPLDMTVVAVTDSTIIDKPQARRSLEQKERPKSAITEIGHSFYNTTSNSTTENSNPSIRDGKRALEMTRESTYQKDNNTATRPLHRTDTSTTRVSTNDVMQVGPEKFNEYSPQSLSKSTSEAMTLASTESRRRSLSQFANGMNTSPIDYENTEPQASMMRTASHQSAPFATRAFTPPAPPLGSNRAPTQPSPVFVSPIPLRSRMPNDNYATSYAPPPHYQSYQPPPNPVIPENYPNHPMFQDYTEFSYPPPPTLYSSMHSATQPALSEVQVAQQYLQGEQNDNPLVLISKLVSVLPELQMFITQFQQPGSDSDHTLLTSSTSEQQNDHDIKGRMLEEKMEKDEQIHKEEILALSGQISDLQTRLRYIESDLADSKKSRDDLYEQLVMQRIESASTIKLLMSEKEDLQKQYDNTRAVSEKEAQEQLLAIRKEVDREKDQVKELKVQIEQLQTSHEAQESELHRASNQKHNELVESHQRAVQEFETKLEKEVVKSGTLTRQIDELDKKLGQERRCLSDQFDHDKKVMTKNFEEKTALLRGEIKVETTRTSRSKEENAKLVKELGDVRKAAATDRAKFQEIFQSFQDVTYKINQENINLQKIMTASGAMMTDLQNRNSGLLAKQPREDDSSTKSMIGSPSYKVQE